MVLIILILVGYLGHSVPTFAPGLSRRAGPTLASLRAGEPVLKWSCRHHRSPTHAAVSGVYAPRQLLYRQLRNCGAVDGGAAVMIFLHRPCKGFYTACTRRLRLSRREAGYFWVSSSP